MQKVIKLTVGKAYNSEFAPTVFRFQRVPFNLKDVFNRITVRHRSARDAKHRFYWNADYKFWYTQSVASKDEALKEFAYHGVTTL
jgi:hypothetical protein